MLNKIWLSMITLSVICGAWMGQLDAVVLAMTTQAKAAFNLVLMLGGVLIFWLGLMRIAEKAGLIGRLAQALQPIMTRLFPEVPAEDPAMGAMIMNIAANMLGLANAATPFGLKAMAALEKINTRPGVASDAMCMFLAINTSSVQLIPVTGMAFLAAGGSRHPEVIVLTCFLATLCSTVVAVTAARLLARRACYAVSKEDK